MRAIGVKEFMEKQFNCYEFDGKFEQSFGLPEKNFTMCVYGESGNGKTELCMQFAKYCTNFAQVYYNSFEQGVSRSLQKSLERNNMQEVIGKIIFGDRENYDEMITRLSKKRSPQIVIIDSRDYMNLDQEQWKNLVMKFKRKAFIIICWADKGKPKGDIAKAINYMCEIKVKVENFKAFPASRYGGNVPYLIKEPITKLEEYAKKLEEYKKNQVSN